MTAGSELTTSMYSPGLNACCPLPSRRETDPPPDDSISVNRLVDGCPRAPAKFCRSILLPDARPAAWLFLIRTFVPAPIVQPEPMNTIVAAAPDPSLVMAPLETPSKLVPSP